MYELLLISTIESFLMIPTGLAFIGIYANKKRIIISALINSLSILLVRYIYTKYSIPLGSHTLVLTLILELEMRFILKQNFLNSSIAILVGLFSMLWGENILFSLLTINSNNLHLVLPLHFIFFIVSHLLLIILFVVTCVLKRPIIKI
ncbi:hypothetical protein ACER0A_003045 [Haloimpatiens sp. FM7315]|uniref:hypothetical protein n=1 Tax=Haloimpatiens sp. FM7315 TaxID=3298609 RepID=UPI0035A3196A